MSANPTFLPRLSTVGHRRYEHFCPTDGVLDAKWPNYLKRILRRMHERGRLTDEEYTGAIEAPLKFDRAEAPPEKDCIALVKRLTTPLGAVVPAVVKP